MDKEVYINSLKRLVENLNSSVVSLDTDIVIALSRKGPRLLEYLRRNMDLKDFPVMTEHALPFLFERICSSQNKTYRIFIVDDAIYFGSTILTLKEEIEGYIQLCNLADRVQVMGIYACIKDPESMDFGEIPVCANCDIRLGYGHYFVKQVMENLRSLGKSLEVEFPEICYATEKPVNIDNLSYQLKKNFGEDNVYQIKDALGIRSVSILLSKPEEETFRKLRIFVEANRIRIISIAPEVVDTNLWLFNGVGFGSQPEVNEKWRDIVGVMERIAQRFDNVEMDKRNLVRTGVVLLNYFSSLDTFCCYKILVEDAIQLAAGGFASLRIVDADNLYYLLGVESMANEGKLVWENALAEDRYFTSPNVSVGCSECDNIVFESSRLSSMEAESLKTANLFQVLGSSTMIDALSSMFFNQTLMVERASRYLSIERQERLRFGYTYQYLWNFIWNNAQQLKTDQLSASKMHHWVDVQIDNGSIVPQYILSKDTFKWVRVFRPGENEDVLLSHLGRFVVHVFMKMLRTEEDMRLGKVIRSNFEGVLAAVYHQFQSRIEEEEPGCQLEINDDYELALRLLSEEDHFVWIGIVDFLLSKNILKSQDQYIRLALRINNKEFTQNSTLSSELVCDIDSYIDSIMQMMGNRLQAYFVFNNTINYFRRDLYKGEEIYRRLKLLVEDGNLCIADFLDRVQKSNLGAFFAKENIKEVIDRYQAKLSCYEMKDELLLDANSGIDNRLLPYLWKVRQMVFLICVIAMISYGNFDSLYDYLGALPKPVMDKLQGEDFVAYLKSLGKEKNEHLWHDTIFLSHIKKYLYHIILA